MRWRTWPATRTPETPARWATSANESGASHSLLRRSSVRDASPTLMPLSSARPLAAMRALIDHERPDDGVLGVHGHLVEEGVDGRAQRGERGHGGGVVRHPRRVVALERVFQRVIAQFVSESP